MKTTEEIIERAGRDAVLDRFDVKPRVVRKYVKDNYFPASWYRALCDMTGADLDLDLFTFRGMG